MLLAQNQTIASHGVFNFEKDLPYSNQYGRFINFVDPDTGEFNELEWIERNFYYPIRPYTVSEAPSPAEKE